MSAFRSYHRAPRIERLEQRQLLTTLPFGAHPDDTAEFLLGDVAVTVVLLESDGTIDANLEDWTPAQIDQIKAKVQDGVGWWVDQLALQQSVHELNFVLDFTYTDAPVPTSYEPISRPSNDFTLWVGEFLDFVGFNSSPGFSDDIRAFNHAQRLAYQTDWAYTIFVVDAQADDDSQFEPEGDFSRGFAYAGGRFFVMTSERPTSTVAHETAHVFWAMDEYGGGKSYFERRGYLDTQNLNALDGNPNPASRVTSIMDSHTQAYPLHAASPSSLDSIGWRDSDGDGIFDILDVSHMLSGSGTFDPLTRIYHFHGTSTVQTLPNENPSGLGNDITLNQISRAQYRLDGGPWIDVAEYHTASAELDLQLGPLPPAVQQIEIRTVDDRSGVTSPVFAGTTERAASTEQPGINGFLWQDDNGNGVWDSTEAGLGGWTVQLVDAGGQPLETVQRLEPDNYAAGSLLNSAIPGVTLTAIGTGVADGSVIAHAAGTTGDDRVFAAFSGVVPTANWTAEDRQLRIDFDSPVAAVRLDAMGHSAAGYGRLEAYGADGRLLTRTTSSALVPGDSETLSVSRPAPDIAYAIAGGHAHSSVAFDNLRVGADASTLTDTLGAYVLPALLPDTYYVRVEAPPGWTATSPADQVHHVAVPAGEIVSDIDFAFQPPAVVSSWQNPTDALDVNADGVRSPIDALLIINELNSDGSRPLPNLSGGSPPAYLDVSGDSFLSPLDALLVINALNEAAAGGGGSALRVSESPADLAGGVPRGGAEGEDVWRIRVADLSPAAFDRVFSRGVVADAGLSARTPTRAAATESYGQRSGETVVLARSILPLSPPPMVNLCLAGTAEPSHVPHTGRLPRATVRPLLDLALSEIALDVAGRRST